MPDPITITLSREEADTIDAALYCRVDVFEEFARYSGSPEWQELRKARELRAKLDTALKGEGEDARE